LVLPGLVIFFFGLGAMITALVVWIVPLPLAFQLLTFLVSSLLLLFLLRKKFSGIFVGRNRTAGTSDEYLEGYVGMTAVVVQEIKPGVGGKVEFRGSNWQAVSDTAIPEGANVEITGRDNITLKVKPINK
jgi:membrane protein implicated in regulation of membrane protease activity